MGLFDKLFGRPPRAKGKPEGYFKTLTAYSPVFTTWRGGIYESELVRSAINARATHISKLAVEVHGAAKPTLQTRLKAGPNEWQTYGQFLYRLSTILDVENTAFVCPVIGEYGETTGLYPILPSKCELVQYDGEPWIRYKFHSGDTAALELQSVGIMTRYQYRDDFFGESNRAMHPTMELINMQDQAIKEGVRSAATYRFMARVENFTFADDLEKERKRFSKKNLTADEENNGILLFPNTYKDIKQIETKPFVADAEQIELVNKNVYAHFGINEDVLQNRAYGDAWAAFYEGAIEPFAIQFSDVVSKMLFTNRERAQGSYIMATANRLQYMSNADKLSVSAQMADRGLMTRNEIRQIWSLPPLDPEIGDTLPVRGEYYNLGEDGQADTTSETTQEAEQNEEEEAE